MTFPDHQSKCAIFAGMRAELLNMAAAEAQAEEPEIDMQEASLRYDEAAARLLGLAVLAEECGLMTEIAGYLATTYGG